MPQHVQTLRQRLGCYTSATYPLLPLSPRLCSRPGDLEIVRPRSVDYMRICGESALSNVPILVLERPKGSFSGLDRVTGQSPSPYMSISGRAVGKRLGHHSARVGLFSPQLLINAKEKCHGRSSLQNILLLHVCTRRMYVGLVKPTTIRLGSRVCSATEVYIALASVLYSHAFQLPDVQQLHEIP